MTRKGGFQRMGISPVSSAVAANPLLWVGTLNVALILSKPAAAVSVSWQAVAAPPFTACHDKAIRVWPHAALLTRIDPS
jgi:hypothetical protein